jgi:hypothetical protein
MKKNENRRLKLCYPPWGRPLKGKTLLKKLDITPSPHQIKPRKGRQYWRTPGGKKENKYY